MTVWDITVQKTGAFVVSRLLLAPLSAFFMSIFLWLIDVPYWLPLGLFTGVVSQFIPTIGTYLGIALPRLVAVFNDPLDVVDHHLRHCLPADRELTSSLRRSPPRPSIFIRPSPSPRSSSARRSSVRSGH